MSVIRVNKSKDYVVMSNIHLKEKNMSLKAKGLLSQMLSLPDDWDYSIEGLARINKENIVSIRSALKELQEFGYLIINKLLPNQTDSGRIEYVYDIYEIPQTEKQEDKKQDIEKQDVENLHVEFLHVENHSQYNINNKNINNKILNNNNIYTQVIDYLNEKTNQNYRYTTNKTRNLINARVKEGYTIDDFKKVIDNKVSDWKDSDMEKYLRPETLFGNKFEGYLNQKSKVLPNWYGKSIEKGKDDSKELEEILKDFT